MISLCPNGHIRTEENTRYHKHGRGDSTKRRCMDCKRRPPNGRLDAAQQKTLRTTELHEDIEDLLRFGATYQEILQRSGYRGWDTLSKSLRKRGRLDLLEKLRIKKG